MSTQPTDASELLKEELTHFKEHKAEWLTHYRGKYLLIKGTALVDHFTTFEEAYKAGVEQFGREPFLIKRLTEQEPEVQMPALFTGMIGARL